MGNGEVVLQKLGGKMLLFCAVRQGSDGEHESESDELIARRAG